MDKMVALSDWVKVSEVPDLILKVTGKKPHLNSVYYWIKTGKLRVAYHRPLRTKRSWIMKFLDEHRRTGQ